MGRYRAHGRGLRDFDLGNSLLLNLLQVTIGNIIGGAGVLASCITLT